MLLFKFLRSDSIITKVTSSKVSYRKICGNKKEVIVIIKQNTYTQIFTLNYECL